MLPVKTRLISALYGTDLNTASRVGSPAPTPSRAFSMQGPFLGNLMDGMRLLPQRFEPVVRQYLDKNPHKRGPFFDASVSILGVRVMYSMENTGGKSTTRAVGIERHMLSAQEFIGLRDAIDGSALVIFPKMCSGLTFNPVTPMDGPLSRDPKIRDIEIDMRQALASLPKTEDEILHVGYVIPKSMQGFIDRILNWVLVRAAKKMTQDMDRLFGKKR